MEIENVISKLTKKQNQVLKFLLENMDAQGYYFGSQRDIASLTGISEMTVFHAITALQKMKAIKRMRYGVYKITVRR